MKIPEVVKSVRYALAAVNGLFVLTGVLFLVVGSIILVMNSQYDDLITKRFYTLPKFMIATGVIIFLTSVLGFYAAISEKTLIIAGYVVLLLIILFFELTITIMAYSLESDAASDIRSPMIQSLQLYEGRLDIAKIWDELQMEFQCCGVAGVGDWVSTRVPVSCCHIDYGTVSPFNCNPGAAYTTGCASVLGAWLAYNAYVIAVTALFVTCLQTVITAVAGWLTWRSKFEEVELES